jgi:hypothetical protein
MIPLYCENNKLKTIDANKKKISDLTKNNQVMILDCKAHFDVFDITSSEVYEALPTAHISDMGILNDVKKTLLKCMHVMTDVKKPSLWRKTIADAAKIYTKLQNIKIMVDGQYVQPKYYVDTFSGRSRATDFPIQTTNDNLTVDVDFDYFIHLDWLSADMRIASILSNDADLISSFERSDPYTYLSETLDLPRHDCKTSLLAAIYSLTIDEPILQCFPRFRDWMDDTVKKLRSNKHADSILGRRFYMSDKTSDKTLFNATIQGSVAHAMHLVLKRAFDSRHRNVFTELQDSLVLIAKKDEVGDVLEDVLDIMLHPFEGVLDDNPTFPVRVSIGKKWRNWKKYKEFR